MRELPHAGDMHTEPEHAKGGAAARLAGLRGVGGGHTAFAAWEIDLFETEPDDRAGIRGRQRETRDALHAPQRTQSSKQLDNAQVRGHEPQEAGHLEGASSFSHFTAFCFSMAVLQ